MQGATQALRAELTGVDPGSACCVRAELATLLALAVVRPDPADPDWCRVSVPGAGLARRISGLLDRERRRGTVHARGRRVEISVDRALISELLGVSDQARSDQARSDQARSDAPPDRRRFARGKSAWDMVLTRVGRKRCCVTAHLRALMVANVHLVNPGRGYHLEVILPDAYPTQRLSAVTNARGEPFHALERRGRVVLYLKAWEQIAELLGQVGAVGTMLSFEEVTVERRMREGINRAVNGEVANLKRVSGAAAAQLDAIRWLTDEQLLDAIPERLREVARLREANPDEDLATLAARTRGLSRSGLFHRLRDLVAAARELKAQRKKTASERIIQE